MLLRGEEWSAEIEHLELSLGTVQWSSQDRTHPANSGHGGQPAVPPWEQAVTALERHGSSSEFHTGPQCDPHSEPYFPVAEMEVVVTVISLALQAC